MRSENLELTKTQFTLILIFFMSYPFLWNYMLGPNQNNQKKCIHIKVVLDFPFKLDCLKYKDLNDKIC